VERDLATERAPVELAEFIVVPNQAWCRSPLLPAVCSEISCASIISAFSADSPTSTFSIYFCPFEFTSNSDFPLSSFLQGSGLSTSGRISLVGSGCSGPASIPTRVENPGSRRTDPCSRAPSVDFDKSVHHVYFRDVARIDFHVELGPANCNNGTGVPSSNGTVPPVRL